MYGTRKEIILRRSVIVAIVIIVVIFSFFIFGTEDCENYSCFEANMIECSRAIYTNEELEASWLYTIKGEKQDTCEIEVTLLLAKQGSLGIDRFEGRSMRCFYPLGVSAFPEKDLNLCHGLLKESLQEILIQRLHEYVVGNLGDIGAGLGL